MYYNILEIGFGLIWGNTRSSASDAILFRLNVPPDALTRWQILFRMGLIKSQSLLTNKEAHISNHLLDYCRAGAKERRQVGEQNESESHQDEDRRKAPSLGSVSSLVSCSLRCEWDTFVFFSRHPSKCIFLVLFSAPVPIRVQPDVQ